MILLLAPQGTAFTRSSTDSGAGSESTALSGPSPSVTDTGTSSESGIAVVGGIVPQVGVLPDISLEIGFDASAGLPYAGESIGLDPKVYYRLNDPVGQGNSRDEAGNLEPYTYGGVTKQQNSLLSGDPTDKCYAFNGTTGYLKGLHTTVLDTDELSLVAIVKPDVVTGIRSIIRRSIVEGTPGVQQLIWGMRIVNGYLQFIMRTTPDALLYGYAADQFLTYAGTQLLSPNTEYHVAAIVREGAVELYVDGVMIESWNKSWIHLKKSFYSPENPDDPPMTPYNTELIIGAGASSGGAYQDFYDGFMDEVAVFLHALQPEEIKYLSYARIIPLSFTWTTVSGNTVPSSRLYEFATQRGRQDELREAETGLFNGVLRNQDRRFDPANPSSPYNPQLKPVKPIWCHGTITSEGIVRNFSLFRGDTDNWPQDWKGRVNDVPITGLDAFDVLSQVGVTVNGPVEKTGARIHRILNAAMWPRDLRVIEGGLSYVQAWDEERGKARELLNQITKAESGYLYIDGLGRVVFKQRNTSISPVQATLSNVPSGTEFPFVSAKVVEDKEWIKNDIRIQVTNGPLYVAQDPQSIKDHRIRTLEMELPLLDDGLEGQAKADWLLSLYKDAVVRIREVVLEPQMDDRLWRHVLDRDIGDRVRFKVYPPGGGSLIDLQSIIEYVGHKYVVGRWTTTWIMSPADVSGYWILGTSDLDETTKLAY